MRVFVAGTGTDVGKTHVSCALLRHLRRQGARVNAWKPLASGVSGEGSDTAAHGRALGFAPPAPLHAFAEPISPHLAARKAGLTLSAAAIALAFPDLAAADVVLVESAGGLFSPLGRGTTNVDLARALAIDRLLLVAPDRLGVLHDVGATLRAASAEGLVIDALVLSAPGTVDGSTGTNGDELEALGIARVAARFPRAPWEHPASAAAAELTWAALQARPGAPASA
jgi:dethiobiotin synthetase